MKVIMNGTKRQVFLASDLEEGKTYVGVSGAAKGNAFLVILDGSDHIIVNFNDPTTAYDKSDYDLSTFVEADVTVTVEAPQL